MAFLVPFLAKDRGFYLKYGAGRRNHPDATQYRCGGAAERRDRLYRADRLGDPFRRPRIADPRHLDRHQVAILQHHRAEQIQISKDLKGATIGITSIGGTNHISTRMTLRSSVSTRKKTSSLSPSAMKNSCTTLSRSAAPTPSCWRRPYSIQLKREGFPILAKTAQYVTIPFSGLGMTIDRIKNNRAQIKKVLKAEIEVCAICGQPGRHGRSDPQTLQHGR